VQIIAIFLTPTLQVAMGRS